MSTFLRAWSRADGWTLVAWFGLMAIGLGVLYSCTVDFQGADGVVESTVSRGVFYSQVTWVILGMMAALVCMAIPFRFFETFAYLLYGLSLVSLIAVFLVGTGRGDAHRWLSLGPIGIQPSEVAKVCLIFVLARFLMGRGDRHQLWLVLGAAVLVLPVFLLVNKQPDLGTSLVFPALAIPLLFWAGVRASFLLSLASPLIGALVMFYGQLVVGSTWPWVIYVVGLLAVLFVTRLYMLQSLFLVIANVVTGLSIPLIWERLKPYQQSRILSFLTPGEGDLLGSGYQAFQSKVAIGSGGIFGKGYMAGTQKGLAFLPERHTDFIFSVVGEELGLVGAIIVLALFGLLVYRAMRIATHVKRPFGSALAVGVGAYFAFQALVNISITVGLLPVTGLPLPFLSKGGSSMLTSCMMVGLLLNVSSRWSDV